MSTIYITARGAWKLGGLEHSGEVKIFGNYPEKIFEIFKNVKYHQIKWEMRTLRFHAQPGQPKYQKQHNQISTTWVGDIVKS